MLFKDIFSILWKNKYILLGITLGFMFIGMMMSIFVFMPNQKSYAVPIYISFPGIEENIYPDGSTFTFKDLISNELLDRVREGNEDFSSIDVEKMISKKDIYILDINNSVDEESKRGETYKIYVKAVYFNNVNQAKEFFISLLNEFVLLVNNKSIDSENNYLEAYNNSYYDTRLEVLFDKRQDMIDGYQLLISEYGDINVNNKNLSEYLVPLMPNEHEDSLVLLYLDSIFNEYVPNLDEFKYELELLKNSYLNDIEKNTKLIDEYQICVNESLAISNDADIAPILSVIAEKIEDNVRLEKLIENIDNKLNKGFLDESEKENFLSKLNAERIAINNYCAEYNEVVESINIRQVDSGFYSYNVVEVENGISIFEGAILFFVVGLIIGGISIVMVEKFRERKYDVSN